VARLAKLTSQLEGPTQRNPFGFKFSQKRKMMSRFTRAGCVGEAYRKLRSPRRTYSDVLVPSLWSKSRHQLLTDPEKDEITAVFYCYQNEDDSLPDTTTHPNYHAGYVVVDSPQIRSSHPASTSGSQCLTVSIIQLMSSNSLSTT
jgi:DNA polymerase zeta